MKMELLAPAGNKDQVLVGIDNGCNALYGGLKKWGARSKCDNFDIIEYNNVLDYCHNNGVKFYLTLNSLLRSDELDTITKLLNSGKMKFPDAIICADIGLISLLHKNYPEISLHASTQFGAYTVEDVHFLESFGISRVILARELSLEEIRKICQSTQMQIEVFVHGSQCIAFSGQCIFGGAINKTSGNRGACNGYCRQLYKSNGQLGEFLYQKDLNAIGLINELKQIGVSAIKIEGRYRSADEIAKIVRKYRLAIDGEIFEQQYNGYLDDVVNYKEMFSAINSRRELRVIPVQQLVNTDLVVIESDKGKEVLFYSSDLELSICQFWKSFFSKPTKFGIKISLEVTLQGIKIKMIGTGGWRMVYNGTLSAGSKLSVRQIYDYLSDKIDIGIEEFSANVPSMDKVSIGTEELDKLVAQVNEQFRGMRQNTDCTDCLKIDPDNVVFLSSSISEIKEYQSKYKGNVIYQITSIEKLIEAIREFRSDYHIIYKMPVLDFYNNTENILQLLENKRIMINTFSQLIEAQNFYFSEVIGNYTLNLWNMQAIYIALNFGIHALVVHPEVEYAYYKTLCQKMGIVLYAFAYVHLPVAYTRACFRWEGDCSEQCMENQLSFLDIGSNKKINIVCNNVFGYRSIVPDDVFRTGSSVAEDTMLIIDSSYYGDKKEAVILVNDVNVD